MLHASGPLYYNGPFKEYVAVMNISENPSNKFYMFKRLDMGGSLHDASVEIANDPRTEQVLLCRSIHIGDECGICTDAVNKKMISLEEAIDYLVGKPKPIKVYERD